MPAAAVIPAPIAYIKVAAVKKLVVGIYFSDRGVCAFKNKKFIFFAYPLHGSTHGCKCFYLHFEHRTFKIFLFVQLLCCRTGSYLHCTFKLIFALLYVSLSC